MTLLRTSILTLLTIYCQVSVAQDAQSPVSGSIPPEVLTLEQVIELALGQNHGLKNAKLDIFKAEEQLSAMQTRRLPALHLNASVSQQFTPIDFIFQPGAFGTFPLIGPVPAQETNLGTPRRATGVFSGRVDQPLSQLYRINLRIDQLKLNGELAREELRARQHEVVQNVKRAYWAILQTQDALQSSYQNIELYRELDRVTGEHVMQKVALEADRLDLKVKLAQVEYVALLLNDRLAGEKMRLNQLLGRHALLDFSVRPILEDHNDEVDLAAIRSRALEQRPELRQVRIRVEQAKQNRRLKKSEIIPDASLSFQYLALRNFRDFLPRHLASVGIIVNWELFDWGRKRHELNEIELTLEQTKNDVQEIETSILIEIDDKFRKLQQARQQLRIASMVQEASREHARIMTDRFRLQVSLRKDVLQAQSAVEEADSQYQQSLSSFWNARAEFGKAAGEDQ